MSPIDWLVVAAYLAGMLGLAALVGRRQRSRRDYYLGGNRMSPWSLATSTIATQCSTNSLLGAPAFVGFVAGGGMIWLQYELAVPLAMLALLLLLPMLRGAGHVSAYAFLEDRLGPGCRRLASACFQIFRGIATGVTVYGVALVVTLLVDVSYTQAVLLLMGITILYDVLGGMRAVVISDVLQLGLIAGAVVLSLAMLGDVATAAAPLPERLDALQFSWGLQGGGDYGFWPMLIGGFFLYAAYYGCDQSQAQRVLAARSERAAGQVLLLNGLLRFPLVLLYCLLGLALAAHAGHDPQFVAGLPASSDGEPNYNLVFPHFVLSTFPPGAVGLVMVGIFAAAMSSIDSALNSLSAATVEDGISSRWPLSERQLFLASKLATLGWGAFAVAFSYQVERIAPTVLEAINKIGSMVNGPLLALFAIALLAPGIGQRRAMLGFFAGALCNLILWVGFPGVSWLWWNAFGFAAGVAVAFITRPVPLALPSAWPTKGFALPLLAMAVFIFLACLGFSWASLGA
ncbi:MAG: sodium:solute symporter [Gammaproteobacteria bacterium]|nr:sodium:solute symporter [Gammaproteobacteria bacterium]